MIKWHIRKPGKTRKAQQIPTPEHKKGPGKPRPLCLVCKNKKSLSEALSVILKHYRTARDLSRRDIAYAIGIITK
jgi:hypothetical protein